MSDITKDALSFEEVNLGIPFRMRGWLCWILPGVIHGNISFALWASDLILAQQTTANFLEISLHQLQPVEQDILAPAPWEAGSGQGLDIACVVSVVQNPVCTSCLSSAGS